MVSPHTIPILTSRKINVLHLESSDVCQAACPACARETDINFDPAKKHNLSVEILERTLPIEFVKGLDKMFMCGNYGDPAANFETLDIYRWFRQQNPDIVLGMNTNGALQNAAWWKELAQILNQPQDYVVFSIDGLEDTNSIYRVNVNWNKLMTNVRSFISNDGLAHWDMLVYQHNEHQVDDCKKLAQDMGFRWFRAKVSKRALVMGLERPINWQTPTSKLGPIDCQAKLENSIYIDATGRISPCCWLGTVSSTIRDIKEVEATWLTDNPNPVCSSICRTDKNKTIFADQWQYEMEFSRV